MKGRKHTIEQIISKLREAGVALAKEPHLGLMNRCRGLQRVVRALAVPLLFSEQAKLVVNVGRSRSMASPSPCSRAERF